MQDFLADGPRTTADIWAAGFQEQIYERTLRRARKDANVTAKIAWTNGTRQCYWLLPGQELPAGKEEEKKPAEDPQLEAWLDNYRKTYQPRMPLDDDDDREP